MNTGLLIAVAAALLVALLTGHILARAGFPIPDASKRIGCIDGLRGYLALLVMMHHCDLWINTTHYLAPWGASSSLLFHNLGPGGVALFFMTTGFVFYPRILRGFGRVDWRATYISRVFRILPLQIALIAAVLALSFYLGDSANRGTVRQNVTAVLAWTTSFREDGLLGFADAGAINARVLWSLWYEWQFYLVVLPVLAIVRACTQARLPSYAVPLGFLLFSLAAERVFGYVPPTLRFFALIAFFLPLFACGMLAFELRERRRLASVLRSPWIAAISAVLLALAMAFMQDPYGLPQLAAYALFFACVAAGNSFGGLLALRGSIVLGEISFGLYMLHGVVLFVLFTLLIPAAMPLEIMYAMIPVATLVAVLLSAAAHLAIERPGIALGRRVAGKPRNALSQGIEQAALNTAP